MIGNEKKESGERHDERHSLCPPSKHSKHFSSDSSTLELFLNLSILLKGTTLVFLSTSNRMSTFPRRVFAMTLAERFSFLQRDITLSPTFKALMLDRQRSFASLITRSSSNVEKSVILLCWHLGILLWSFCGYAESFARLRGDWSFCDYVESFARLRWSFQFKKIKK